MLRLSRSPGAVEYKRTLNFFCGVSPARGNEYKLIHIDLSVQLRRLPTARMHQIPLLESGSQTELLGVADNEYVPGWTDASEEI